MHELEQSCTLYRAMSTGASCWPEHPGYQGVVGGMPRLMQTDELFLLLGTVSIDIKSDSMIASIIDEEEDNVWTRLMTSDAGIVLIGLRTFRSCIQRV